MAITAAQVKELRETTGIGMMECKQALTENDGDMDKAIIWLRERGMSRAAKKAGRVAAEGLVCMSLSKDQKKAAIIELNCETDFAAKNENFVALANRLAELACEKECKDLNALLQAKLDGITVEEQVKELVTKVGENMTLRRMEFVSANNGIIVNYNHMNGRIGVLVKFEGDTSSDVVKQLGADIAMHVAASAPKYLDPSTVDTAELEQERAIARKNLEEQGKPKDMIEKILVGQVKKFYSEVCLLEQPFVKDPKNTILQHIASCKVDVKLTKFVRFQIGEGIQLEEKKSFAEEVAAQINK